MFSPHPVSDHPGDFPRDACRSGLVPVLSSSWDVTHGPHLADAAQQGAGRHGEKRWIASLSPQTPRFAPRAGLTVPQAGSSAQRTPITDQVLEELEEPSAITLTAANVHPSLGSGS